MTARFERKVQTRQAIQNAIAMGKLARPIIFTNGVFDILHRGHVTYLDEAAQLGGTLIVGVNTDASVKRLGKALDRPLNNEHDRAALLAALACVDVVTIFDEDTPCEVIEALRPDIIVKGGDYDMATLPETTIVQSWGGKALAIPFEFERSTTAMVKKIRQT
jgi:rfaE bifunctional protein nucleotidyltransferase chain/domain